MPRDAFPGPDDPLDTEDGSDGVPKVLSDDESRPGTDDLVEPVLDE